VKTREPERPSPEVLLRHAAREARGTLKIFLGASPGVGKTYEMLEDGAERLRAGIDVVIGVVETHGRAETEALVPALEMIPRRSIAYHGRILSEMDLDAILARAPQLVLVDELAHTNAPESRHPKRWQDIEELLDAGIDVYSTVNIQHIESLNDVVASFTHVRVRETVPDSVIDAAEIEIVDLPPDELITRLKDGKVYVPEEASRALHHFFSKSNLSALRELALRRAAQAVDAQMLEHLKAHALAGTFAGGERILVAVSELPGSDMLVRTAKRLADALKAPWTALHVETPRDARFDDKDRERLAASLGLAATLGATVATIPARSVMEGLLDQIREMRATQLVIGKSQRSWWFELRHGSVVDRIIRGSEGLAVHVLPDTGRSTLPPRRTFSLTAGWGRWLDYVLMLAGVAGITLLGWVLEPWIGVQAIDMLYLLPVIAAATIFGLRKGVITGFISGLTYNFFFLPPLYTFTVADPRNILTMLVLIAVAVVTSQLAGRVRAQALLGARSARENAAIAGFASTLGQLSDEAETAHAVCAEIARLLDVDTVLLLRQDGGSRLAGAWPPENRLDPLDDAAIDWAFDKGEPAGRGTDTLTASEWQFQPLKTAVGTLAVLGVARTDATIPILAARALLFMSLVDQAALALERLRLETEMRQISALRERDQLRATLLSSIGHDLRTPLTAVTAAAQALKADGANDELVTTIRAEAQRLSRFFDDLIDLTRIEAGALTPKIGPVDLTDAVSSAVQDVKLALVGREIQLDVPPNLPLVRTDPSLLHHILINLLDNAAKFGKPGSPVRLEARRRPDGIILSVVDEGPGLPQGREDRLFETFTRLEGSDRTGGTGLGLAIVKGFASALDIGIAAANREDGAGARFSLHFPEAALLRMEAS
jgi:two-component system sensor histidine kinase KdpD